LADELTAVLRAALRDAVKARDKVATAAVRSALGAIDNAQAADPSAAPPQQPGRIAGGVAGLAAGEVPRRELSDAEAAGIVRAQIREWEAAAADYQRAGRSDSAARLRAESAFLARLLDAV